MCRFLGWRTRFEARAGAVRSRSVRGLKRDGPVLAIALKVLTRRLLRRRARYGRKLECQDCPALAIATEVLTRTSASENAPW